MSVKEFFNYIEFDGVNAIEFMESNNVDIDSFEALVINTVNEIDVKLIEEKNDAFAAKHSPRPKPVLSLEQIRDGMVKECHAAYCCFLEDACAAAVKIAYHYKVETER